MKAIISILLLSFVLYTTADDSTLVQRDLPKICENVLPPNVCTKLRQISAALKIRTEKVEEGIRSAVGLGLVKAEDIYQKTVEFLKNEVLGKVCNDFVPALICQKLNDVAAKLKIKADKVNELVKNAVIASHKNRTEIYETVIEFFRDEVMTKRCPDLLPADVCSKLKAVASKLRITAEKVDEAVREAILKGITKSSELISKVKAFMKEEVLSKKCEYFLPAERCAAIKSLAIRLKVKAEMVDEAVKDAIVRGSAKVKDIYEDVVEYVKRQVKCEDFLLSWSCSFIRKRAMRLGVRIQELNEFLRNLIVTGRSSARTIFVKVISFIKQRTLLG